MTETVCVIDAGTTGVRCGLVDPDGTVHASYETPLAIQHPEPGGAEQRPDDILEAVCSAARGATASAPSDTTVRAITISAQRASIAGLTSSGTVSFGFLLWMDQRGATRLEELAEKVGADHFSALTGLPFGGMPAVTRVLWLRAQHPDAFATTARLIGVQDWITSQLTGGVPTADVSCAAWTGMYDLNARGWSSEILAALGISERLLGDVVTATDQVGTVTPRFAEATGLAAGLPVFAGGGDQQCSSLGAGAFVDTHTTINLGTSATLVTPTRIRHLPHPGLVRGGHLMDDLDDLEGTVPAFGSVLRWLSSTLGYGDTADGYRQMAQEASRVDAGCDGLTFDPSFVGRGTPTWNPSTAAVHGLQLHHGRAHLVRAAMEGLAEQVGDALATLHTAGVRHDRVTLIGGGARSAVWAQLIADVTGTQLDTVDADPQQAPLRGAAMCAWVGLGRFTALAEAAAAGPRAERTFVPNETPGETSKQTPDETPTRTGPRP